MSAYTCNVIRTKVTKIPTHIHKSSFVPSLVSVQINKPFSHVNYLEQFSNMQIFTNIFLFKFIHSVFFDITATRKVFA